MLTRFQTPVCPRAPVDNARGTRSRKRRKLVIDEVHTKSLEKNVKRLASLATYAKNAIFEIIDDGRLNS
ncbi:MAG: hypothetical protein KC616_06800 [Myxococcales bacterium]|nr:hypothetical protein [Myxococcales bacterium]